MQINKLGTRSPIFHNLVCKNGVDAEFGISEDPCFESVVYQEDPNEAIKLEKLIGWWKFEGSHQGVVRGDYSGAIPDVRFNGDPDPAGTNLLYTSTLGELTVAFSHELQAYRCYQALGDCVIDGLDNDDQPIFDCDGNAEVTATTVCQGTVNVDLSDDFTELRIVPPSNFNVEEGAYDLVVIGSFFEATGGVPPYQFQFPGVDQTTGEVLSIDPCIPIENPRITIPATVTDSCNNTDVESIIVDRQELSITGTDTPVVGSIYSANGTAPPFTFSFAGGSINSTTGEILSINACVSSGDSRTSLVVVTDSCGLSEGIVVRLPGGAWRNIYYEYSPDYSEHCRSGTTSIIGWTDFLYEGRYRTAGQYETRETSLSGIPYRCLDPLPPWGTGCNDCDWRPSFPVPEGINCSGNIPPSGSTCIPYAGTRADCQQGGTNSRGYCTLVKMVKGKRQEWVCP
jgi:hypothetical protein